MKCKKCKKNAIYTTPTYCKQHFFESIEKQVEGTIKKYSLIQKNDHIVVAVSGGKDSLTVLYILNKFKEKYSYTITALAIDEGIANYRNTTLETLKSFCTKHSIALHIESYKTNFGSTLDTFLTTTHKEQKPCTLCGALRRNLLNKNARLLKATKLATGHNLDDEAQALLMNLFRSTPSLSARLGPITGVIEDTHFIPRIKPLYFIPEKQITAYSFLQNFGINYVECPNATQAYRGVVGDVLNDYEQKKTGTKQNIILHFLKRKEKLRKLSIQTMKALLYCKFCNEPAATEICKTCMLLNQTNK